MPEIRVVLLTLPWRGHLLAALRKALLPAEVIEVNRFDAWGINRALKRADVAIVAGDVDDRYVRAPHMRWVHCGHAGLDQSAQPGLFDRGLLLTSAAGRSAPALAEHALFFMLALSFRFGHFYAAQRAHRWGVPGQRKLRALHGQTLGIVGLGHTGIEVARRAKAFGMRVIAYRRRAEQPPEVDRLYCTDLGGSLDELLAASDYVVLVLPLSDKSLHLIGAPELAKMRRGAHLINIARGGLIDEEALLQALHSGHLAGAAIDVAEQEPLPSDSPLWDAPNLLITPHVTPRTADRDERALQLLVENIRRYRADEPLLNRISRDDQFTPSVTDSAKRSGLACWLARARRFQQRAMYWLRTR